MKNKVVKILSIFILSVILIFAFSQLVNAWTPDWTALDDADTGETGTLIYSIMATIINIVKIVGAGIAIIMLIVIGIQYMSKSPEGKAQYKETIMPYVTGAILLFAASALVQIIQMFASAISDSITG